MAATLSAEGWPVDKTGNLPNRSKTTVTYGAGGEEAAKQMAAKVGVTAVPTASSADKAGQVVIVIGADYTPPGGGQPTTGSNGSTASAPAAGTTSSAPPVVIPTVGQQGGAVSASGDGVPCVN